MVEIQCKREHKPALACVGVVITRNNEGKKNLVIRLVWTCLTFSVLNRDYNLANSNIVIISVGLTMGS